MLWGKVSREGARDDYGVVVARRGDAPAVDDAASDALRADLRAARGEQPFFDRGPGYARLAAGATSADVDWLLMPPSPLVTRGYGRSTRRHAAWRTVHDPAQRSRRDRC